jgi:probable phosphoglycerate mutase
VSQGRVFLLRHGETEWSRSGQHTGRSDIPLTDRGRLLANATGGVGRYLLGESPFVVWCSPRLRARDTAELAGLAVDRIDDRLVEWDYGDYEGVTTEEIRETVPGWTVWTHPCPHGETAHDVAARADSVLADARVADTDVVLVGHGHFSRVLVSRWLARPAGDGVHFAMDAAAWAVLGDERGVPRIDGLNYRPLA